MDTNRRIGPRNRLAIGARLRREVAGRRRVEEALRRSVEAYRTLVENVNDVIYSLDTQGLFTYISPAIERFAGYAVSEVEGQPFVRFVHPDDLPGLQVSFAHTLSGIVEPYEFRVFAKDGTALHVRAFSRIQYDAGHPVGLTGVMTDLTARVQSENEIRKLNAELEQRVRERTAELEATNRDLRDSEGRYRVLHSISEAAYAAQTPEQLFKSIHAIIARLMPARNFYIALYDAATDWFSFPYHSDEFDTGWLPMQPGTSLTGYVLHTGRALLATADVLEQLSRSGQVEPLGPVPVDWLGVPLKTQAGEVIGVMVVQSYNEATRLQEADKNLLEFITTQVAMVVARKQAEERIRGLNRMLQVMIVANQVLVRAADEAELLQRVCQTLVELGGCCLAQVTLTEAGEAPATPLAASAGDAEAAPAWFTEVPVASRGRVLGVLRVGIPELRNLDEEEVKLLGELADDLAFGIMALRTRAEVARLYAQEQQRSAALAGALEHQRRLDRLQQEFLQNVSHELRTPLALIRGHAELLESGALGGLQPGQEESATVIARRAHALTGLLDEITSALEVEQRTLVHRPVDLAMVARETAAGFRTRAEIAGVVLSVELAAGVPVVPGDTLALHRVLESLVGNAVKFTPPGGSVTVRLYSREDAVRLEVADTGVGIPPEHLGRIFERFYQVDGSTTRRYGGMGLGLALVQEIVTAHGGSVTVESTVGQGSTFVVSLPILAK